MRASVFGWPRAFTGNEAYYKGPSGDFKRREEPPGWRPTWIPEGFKESTRVAVPGMAGTQWAKVTQAEGRPKITDRLIWYYSREPQITLAGTPETVTINGARAQHWPGNPNAKSSLASADGEVVSICTSEAQMNPLLWTDPRTSITFHLLALLNKDVIIRMAESIILNPMKFGR